MPKCDAVFVSLMLHDVARRPAFSDARDKSATILPVCSNGGHPCLHYRGAFDEVFVTEEELDSVLNCKCFYHTGTGLPEAAAKVRRVVTCACVLHLSEGTLDVITPLLLYAAYIPSSYDPIEVASFFALGRYSVQRVPAYVLRASDFMGSGDAYSGSFIGVERFRMGSVVGTLVASGLGSDAGVMNWGKV
ncbi:hypothetical protein CGC21_34100 [Leishmania donovani]|uniref:Uncharacterized protein n=1 Tax=Leishmania donovani TaxID=5661 RepID=A0A504XJP5_LEIDO|nr:hypothetical protein CGC21_34100 [Leishmania donovani]